MKNIFVGILIALVVLVVGFAVSYSKDTVVDYYAYCEKEVCSSFGKREFRVDIANQTVISSQYGVVWKFEGCEVFDKKNWSCTSNDEMLGYDIKSMNDGIYNHMPLEKEEEGQVHMSRSDWLWKKHISN